MKFSHLLVTVSVVGLLGVVVQAHDKNTSLNDEQKTFLAQYESVRAALATDDLPAAKKAAASITTGSKSGEQMQATPDQAAKQAAFAETMKKLTAADSLKTARDAFKQLSKRAVHFAEGKPGYYVAHCPMVENNEGDWVQTTKKISNPYLGTEMPTCGTIKG